MMAEDRYRTARGSRSKINHAVTVVGYGNQGGKPYWLIKNSWGDNWEDGGYVEIVRGKTACRIDKIVP